MQSIPMLTRSRARRFASTILAVALVAVNSSLASAHPGHIVEIGEPDSWSHYLTHPDHTLPLLAVAVVAVFCWVFRNEYRRRDSISRG